MRETLHYLSQIRELGVIDDYAVGDAMAATFYIEPITTFDLDVFVMLPQEKDSPLFSLAPLYEHLRAAGFQEEKECVIINGVPVQFLPAYNPLTEEALEQAVEMDYDDVKVRVFSAEHLVAIALQTGRSKDKARVHSFVESGILRQEKLLDILRHHGLEAKWRHLTTNQP